MLNVDIKEGDVIEGRITGIQSYGVFLQLNDECSGLVHATELARLGTSVRNQPFKIGQTLKVKVLRIKPGGKQAVLKIHREFRSKGRVTAKQFETKSGFENIQKQLMKWIQEAKNSKRIK